MGNCFSTYIMGKNPIVDHAVDTVKYTYDANSCAVASWRRKKREIREKRKEKSETRRANREERRQKREERIEKG